jgi:predicted homoserine dehydrogenase-like protein
MIGLELGVSIASAALRGEPTGAPDGFRADVVATAKRDLAAGETLDGEGGYTVYGKLLPAKASLEMGGLPIGLAHGVTLTGAVAAGEPLRWSDVAVDGESEALAVRKAMERRFAAAGESV